METVIGCIFFVFKSWQIQNKHGPSAINKLLTVAPRYNEQHMRAQQNYSKICGNKPRYNE